MNSFGTWSAICPKITPTAAWKNTRSDQNAKAQLVASLPPGWTVGAGWRRSSSRTMHCESQ